jgi:antagonist of KipI
MSLKIIRQGILDTIQDTGRYGYQHLGINCNGAMDRFSLQLANALLGKELNAPALESHFPASQISFEKGTIICLAGADFCPTINGQEVPLHHPIAVARKSLLRFERIRTGSRCYISFLQDLQLEPWMNSYSTNIKSGTGGYQGRRLLKDDVIRFRQELTLSNLLQGKDWVILPWKAHEAVDTRNEIKFIIGSEWNWLTSEGQESFREHWFQITMEADRMGYQLTGPGLKVKNNEQLVSSAVSFGTVQLLPTGRLILLMADHQTVGGYPRVAHVISAHLPVLAQKKTNDVIRFKMTSLQEAEKKSVEQKKYLSQLQIACKFRMEEFLHAHL